MRDFNSILVANRGEIAARIIRTAKALGYRTIAIYSEADSSAPHLALADDAVLVGPSPAAQSYLDIERIVAAAAATGAEAVHPGYGFLSENAAFARACVGAGLVFIGPSADVIEAMGNKAAAKRLMIGAGVPCVPGYEGEDQSDEALIAAAGRIGYPIMVKAAAGGGGRGMRLVDAADKLPEGLKRARSEAGKAFGSEQLILEKAVIRPRHVEVQIFADAAGNVIHLGERDCSVQRRHQKVIEEAPCPVMTPQLRQRMGDAAVKAARAIGYLGAGTVEFLLDAASACYFLEMNTRLQVEHPVTELVTGLDLVALQIGVARGQPLPLSQEDVRLSGHAIEARLYAEDPGQNFLPVAGDVSVWQPAGGEGVRIDAGILTGSTISSFYDPLLAKVVAWGPDRSTAIRRLRGALCDTRIFGTRTNKGFLADLLAKPDFASGAATTAFIAESFTLDELAGPECTEELAAIAAVACFEAQRDVALQMSLGIGSELLNWASPGPMRKAFRYRSPERPLDVSLVPKARDDYAVKAGETQFRISVIERLSADLKLVVNGRARAIGWHYRTGGALELDVDAHVSVFLDLLDASRGAEISGESGAVAAPMHGTLIEVLVREGQTVVKGQRLAILEAMKMQHDIAAEISGVVEAIECKAGVHVAVDDILIRITAAESGSGTSLLPD